MPHGSRFAGVAPRATLRLRGKGCRFPGRGWPRRTRPGGARIGLRQGAGRLFQGGLPQPAPMQGKARLTLHGGWPRAGCGRVGAADRRNSLRQRLTRINVAHRWLRQPPGGRVQAPPPSARAWRSSRPASDRLWLRRQCAATSRPVFAIIESELTPVSKRLVDDLNKIKAARKRGRRKRFSRLDMYREQISTLAATGGSTEDIRIWLRQHASVMVARSTVWRALARWKAEGG